jgi:hypothetical protein
MERMAQSPQHHTAEAQPWPRGEEWWSNYNFSASVLIFTSLASES